MIEDIKRELAELINKYNLENESNTPDYIIAEYLYNCLENYNLITKLKDKWYGKKITINGIEEVKE